MYYHATMIEDSLLKYYIVLKISIIFVFNHDFQKGEYGTVSEVAGDMNIMFENAKKYNMHTSRLYKVIIL